MNNGSLFDAFLPLSEFEAMKAVNYEAIPIAKDFRCPDCGRSTQFPIHMNEVEPTPIGWCDTEHGIMGIFECPLCFSKFRFHISTNGRWSKDKFYEDFALLWHLWKHHQENKDK